MKRFVLIGLLLIVFACEDKKGDDEKPEDTYACESIQKVIVYSQEHHIKRD